jgi:hypothetical protein
MWGTYCEPLRPDWWVLNGLAHTLMFYGRAPAPAGRSVKLFLQMIWTGFEAMSTDNRAHARAGLNHDLDLLKQKGMWNRDGNLVVLWKRRMIAKADISGGITCMDFISTWMGRVGRDGGPT